MTEIIAHVISAERQHGKRVAPKLADFSRGRRGHFRTDNGSQECAVLPVKGFMNKRNDAWPPAAEEYCRNRNAFGIFPRFVDNRALSRRCCKPGVGMRRRAAATR